MTEERKLIRDELKPMHEAEAIAIPPEMRERADIFQIAAEILKEEGVQYLFALTAGSVFYPEIWSQKLGIPRVHVRHEQAATFAADTWGRITRKPGVVLTTGSTAVCYATAGICQAYSAGSPVVYIMAEDAMSQERRYGGMGISRTEHQLEGITKWVRKVATNSSYLYQLKRALRSALTPPTVPVAISYPRDMVGSTAASRTVSRMVAQQLYTPGYWAPEMQRNLARPGPGGKSLEVVPGGGEANHDCGSRPPAG